MPVYPSAAMGALAAAAAALVVAAGGYLVWVGLGPDAGTDEAPGMEVASAAAGSEGPDAASDAAASGTTAGTGQADETVGSASPAVSEADARTVEDTTPATPAPPDPDLPQFDVVRVDRNGQAVIAGRAPRDGDVVLRLDGQELATARADRSGSFVAMVTLPAAEAPRMLTLEARDAAGTTRQGRESVIVAPSFPPAPAVPDAPAPAAATRPEAVARAEGPVDSREVPDEASRAAAAGTAERPDAEPGAATTTGRVVGADDGDGALGATGGMGFAQTDRSAGGEARAAGESADAPGKPALGDAPEGPESIAAAAGEAGRPAAGPAPSSTGMLGEGDAVASVTADRIASPGSDRAEALDGATIAETSARDEPRLAAASPDNAGSGESGSETPDPIAQSSRPASPDRADAPAASTAPPAVDTSAPTAAADIAAIRTPNPGEMPEDPPRLAAAPEGEAPPRLIRVGPDGVSVLPQPGARPEVTERLGIDVITYDAQGEVQIAGTAGAASNLRIYLDNRPVRAVDAAAGNWASPLPDVDAGVYTLRIDALDEAGRVAARVETPFERIAPERAIAARSDGTAAITVQPGFTLWAISESWFGEGEGIRYVQIFEANRDRIRDPDLIYPGQVFALPEPAEQTAD